MQAGGAIPVTLCKEKREQGDIHYKDTSVNQNAPPVNPPGCRARDFIFFTKSIKKETHHEKSNSSSIYRCAQRVLWRL